MTTSNDNFCFGIKQALHRGEQAVAVFDGKVEGAGQGAALFRECGDLDEFHPALAGNEDDGIGLVRGADRLSAPIYALVFQLPNPLTDRLDGRRVLDLQSGVCPVIPQGGRQIVGLGSVVDEPLQGARPDDADDREGDAE